MNEHIPSDDPALWRDVRSQLLRFVRGRVRDPIAAEDIVQDVLVKATAQLQALRDEERLQAWLYRITRHAIVDHHRTRRPTEELADDPPAPLPETPDDGAAAELAGCVSPMLGGLPDTYREAVRLAELEGLTQREVADRLELSLSGAKSRVQRGRRMLREAFVRCCAVETDVRGGVMDFHTRGRCGEC